MQELSSRYTFALKYIAPVVWIGGFGGLALRLLTHPPAVLAAGIGLSALVAIRWVLPVAWIAASVQIVRQSIPIKRIRVDGDFLLISNYFREVRVPIRTVVDIYHGDRSNSPVTLGFKDHTPFGGQIVFIPGRPRHLLVSRDDYAVEELRRLAHVDSAPETRAT